MTLAVAKVLNPNKHLRIPVWVWYAIFMSCEFHSFFCPKYFTPWFFIPLKFEWWQCPMNGHTSTKVSSYHLHNVLHTLSRWLIYAENTPEGSINILCWCHRNCATWENKRKSNINKVLSSKINAGADLADITQSAIWVEAFIFPGDLCIPFPGAGGCLDLHGGRFEFDWWVYIESGRRGCWPPIFAWREGVASLTGKPPGETSI